MDDILGLLKIHYGYDKLRVGQEEAIRNVLGGKSTVVIMPTGGGKSLCYQLPSLVLDGVTVVISPLIALMKDQVDSLKQIGIPATFINSSISQDEALRRLYDVTSGNYKLLYIAPERFYNREFMLALSKVKVSLFAVDEAHCISHWGHDFRPSYMKLREMIALLGKPTVIALTATATPEVRADIAKQLGIDDHDVIITGFSRANLQFGVIQTNDSRKPQLVLEAINSVERGSGIVYVGTRSRADDLLNYLLENDIEAVSYHAGMDADSREWIQNNFMTGKARVIIATNAFGMGIDKSDIRFVIHYDMPGTIEAYYQEAGRAGRDGQPSFCLLLYSSRDKYLQEFFIKGDNPTPDFILNVYEVLMDFGTDKVLITYNEIKRILGDDSPDMAVGTAVKILEREGYLARSKEKSSNAFVKLLAEPETILENLGKKAKKQIELFNNLVSKYRNNLYDGWEVNFEDLASMVSVKKDAISRLIKKLEKLDLVEYRPPFKGTEINVLKRLPRSEVRLDFTAIQEKLRAAYEKLDKMEGYIYDFSCRQKYILNYFGESDYDRCGKCDNCLISKNRSEYIDNDMADFGQASLDGDDKPQISTKLTQLETFELYKQGKSLEEIALIRNLKPATIIEHICYLIENKMAVKAEDFVPRKRQGEIMAAIEKVGTNKLSLIREELGEEYSWDEIKIVVAKAKSLKK